MDQHGLNMWIISLAILTAYTTADESVEGGKCYSASQVACQPEIGNFWAALINKDINKVCMHLKEVNACTEGFLSGCDYQSHELELYETDIVATYTKPPYSCPLTRGTIKKFSPKKADKSLAAANTYHLATVISSVNLVLLMMWMM